MDVGAMLQTLPKDMVLSHALAAAGVDWVWFPAVPVPVTTPLRCKPLLWLRCLPRRVLAQSGKADLDSLVCQYSTVHIIHTHVTK